MDYDHHLPPAVRAALRNPEPGAWMPPIPPGSIRLSAGYPDPALVPVEELAAAVQRLVSAEYDLPFHYLGSRRMEELREWIAERLAHREMPVRDGELLVTAGSCQAIDLVARTLLDADTEVWVEAPTYMEALEIFRNYTPHIHSVPVDEEGLKTDVLAERLRDRRRRGSRLPRLLYTIPSFQNPTGATLSLQRRRELLQLANEHDVLILEDDAYGELWFDEPLPTLRALDSTGRVIHLGSLSKVVAPGLRIGWIAAPAPLIHACGWFKKDLDHPFAEATVAEYLRNTDFPARLAQLRQTYRVRRDHLLQALASELPPRATWTSPSGGYFVWVRIPGINTDALLSCALQHGVTYVPGRHFFTEPDQGRDALRLSFSHVPLDDLAEGVHRLAQALRSIITI